MSLATEYLNGANHDFKTEIETVEWEENTCGHYGNCPCGGRMRERKVYYQIFTDGSVYVDDIDELTFESEGDFENYTLSDDYIQKVMDYESY